MLLNRVGIGGLCALPGALTIYFALNAGGYFPRQPAIVAVFLALTLVSWTTIADRPYAGASPAVGLVAGALSLYALWVLVSSSWSHAAGRSFVEFDRALVYMLAVVLFGSVATSPARLRWMLRGVALAILVICVVALATRLFPDIFPIPINLAVNRLSYPITYWNVLGLLAAIGIVLCLHLTGSTEEPAVARVLAAAAIPVLAGVLYFTFGRGAIVVAIVGVIGYCLLARSRMLLTALLAVVPPTVVAIVAAYHADQLASQYPTDTPAVAQGHRLAIVIGACIVVAALARALISRTEPRLLSYEVPRELRRRSLAGLGGAIAVAIAVSLATGAPHALASQYDRFIKGATPGRTQDLRTRLFDPANNGRTNLWNVSLRAFREAPFHGQGAGTFELDWKQHAPTAGDPNVNAHSLYFENLGELGIIGIGLLAAALATTLVGTLRRARAPTRGLYAAVSTAFLVWVIHAGADWDWQMPVVTFCSIALGAAALSAWAPESTVGTSGLKNRGELRMPESLRLPIAIGWLAVAVTPALVSVSHAQTVRAANALASRDCRTARNAAFSSIGTLGGFSAPYEIVGYCDLQMGLPRAAIGAMRAAVKRDPQNWQYHEGLAIASAAAGLDPRPEAGTALRLYPLYDIAQRASGLLTRSSLDQWPAAAATARGLMLNNVQVGRD